MALRIYQYFPRIAWRMIAARLRVPWHVTHLFNRGKQIMSPRTSLGLPACVLSFAIGMTATGSGFAQEAAKARGELEEIFVTAQFR
jgi:hypothetical protein